MHIKAPVPALALLTSVLLGASASAQELRLFEPIESEQGNQPVTTGPEQVFTVGNGQPAVTLRSTSRFGDQYQAVLVSRSGETFTVHWREGESAPVPGMGGFAVVGISSAGVALMHPPGDPCVSAEASGVLCQSGNQASLRLATSAPLASNGVTAVQTSEQAFGGADPLGPNAFNGAPAPEGPQVFINPFSGEAETLPAISEEERQARQQRQEVRAARLRQFEQAATIEDADIPPGMQRVRTPFGDRLIPVRE